MSDELAALRARVASLEAEVATLRARERRRVLPGLPHDFTMPNDAELRELCSIVWAEIPALRPPDSKRESMIEQVRTAFLAQATLPRRTDGKYDTRYDRSVWLDRAGTTLSRAGLSSTFSTTAFMTAMLAAGDVAYCIDPARIPLDSYWGYGDHHGAPQDSAAWRTVLTTRRIRPPLPLPRQSHSDVAPVGLVPRIASW